MTADVALAEIEWLDDGRRVEVILSEGNDALLGTEMCEGATLVIDYPNRSVLISEPAMNPAHEIQSSA
jgi:hypothetical protein